MIVYIYGGVASGKSKYAEEIISKSFNNKIYLATMENIGNIASKRADKNFTTVEEPRNLQHLNVSLNNNILLEDLTNLLSNNIFDKYGIKSDFKEITEKIFSDIIELANRCNSVFIVGNDIFSTKRNQSKELDIFIDCLFYLHKKIIEVSDRVVEVVYGLPYNRKLK